MRKVGPWWRASAAIAALAVAGCSDRAPSALSPKGPGARHIATLGYILFALAGFVFVVVIGYLAYGLFRRRRGDDEPKPLFKDGTIVVIGGIVMPLVILLTVMGLTVNTLVTLRASGTVHLEVIGHQFWFEVRYPEANVTSANEIHIPAGADVEMALSSVDVDHSFWVPQLMGKIDMIPGQRNLIQLKADQPGTYRGQCAEFCGIQHAKMAFLVIADPPDQFSAWLAAQQKRAAVPPAGRARDGSAAFLTLSCAACHTIRGTEATGKVGPDLTHFGSRTTIGSVAIPNNPGNLGGWIANAQSIKPGSAMPPVPMSPDQELGIIEYLETLR
jgi:cytochrome c oxidase subunit 2